MDGQIGIRSKPGEGSCFWIQLPLLSPSHRTDRATVALQSQKIWLLDSCLERLEAACNRLEFSGIQVRGESRAQTLLDHLQQSSEQAELLVLDLGSGELENGYLLREARSHKLSCLLLAGESQLIQAQADYPQLRVIKRPAIAGDLLEQILRTQTPPLAPDSAATESQPEPESAALRILVAEDNSVNQMVLKGMLAKLSHACDIQGDGQQALQAYRDRADDFDVILMDCEMPVLNGFLATEQIRQWEQGQARHIDIIALTAHAEDSYRQQCLGAGMDDFLTKPLQLDNLQRALEQLANRAPSSAP